MKGDTDDTRDRSRKQRTCTAVLQRGLRQLEYGAGG